MKKYLELPHRETVISTNTIQTKPFDNQKEMSNNKQSSVEWYAEKEHEIAREFVLANINHREYFDKKRELLEQAKAMHKEEHGKTWDESMDNFIARGENYVRAYVDFEDYYAETFGGNND